MAKHSPYFNVTSLPEKLFAKKYEVTPNLYEDKNQVENYQIEALRYSGPDSVIFSSDLPRRNTSISKQKIDLFDGGSRYSLEPAHRDVFLGETGRDNRGINSEPNLQDLIKQNQFRMRYQKDIFINDASNGVPESGITENKMMEIKKQGFYSLQDRLKIFNESRDGWIAGHNAKTTNESKVLLSELETENPELIGDDVVLDNTGKRDVVSDFSLANPVGWRAVDDTKYKIASYSYLYEQKDIKDTKIRKIFDQSLNDVKYTTYEDNQIPKSIVYLMDNIKRARQARNEPSLDNMKESQESKIRKINQNTNEGGVGLEKFEVDQKQSKLLDTIIRNQKYQAPTDYSNNRNEAVNDKKNKNEQIRDIAKQQSINNTDVRKLMNMVVKSSKDKTNNIETMTGKYVSPKFLEKMVNSRHSGREVVDFNSIQKNRLIHTNMNKRQKEGMNNNVSKDQVKEGKKYYNHDSEYINDTVAHDYRIPETGVVLDRFENDFTIKDTTPINRMNTGKRKLSKQLNQLYEIDQRDEITGRN